MTSITSQNFEEKFPELFTKIQECDFISFDCEFSGLHSVTASGLEVSQFDSADIYYRKAKMIGEKFSLLQLGLSFFKYNSDTKQYHADTYEFLVNKNNFRDQKFEDTELYDVSTYQMDCINFLARSKFNFNNLFLDGIPCRNLSYEIDSSYFDSDCKEYSKDGKVNFLDLYINDSELSKNLLQEWVLKSTKKSAAEKFADTKKKIFKSGPLSSKRYQKEQSDILQKLEDFIKLPFEEPVKEETTSKKIKSKQPPTMNMEITNITPSLYNEIVKGSNKKISKLQTNNKIDIDWQANLIIQEKNINEESQNNQTNLNKNNIVFKRKKPTEKKQKDSSQKKGEKDVQKPDKKQTETLITEEKIKSIENSEKSIDNNLPKKLKSEIDSQSFLIKKFGLSMIMAEIMKHKKLIVGHYCILDIMYMYSTFVSKQLPIKYAEFCSNFQSYFGELVDTKVVVNFPAKKIDKKLKSGLKFIYDNFKTYEQKLIDPQNEMLQDSNEIYHDAGFDAFMTGYNFIYLCEIVKNNHSLKPKNSKEVIDFSIDLFKNLANGSLREGYQGYENIQFSAHGNPLSIATSQVFLEESDDTNGILLFAEQKPQALSSLEKRMESLEKMTDLQSEYGTFKLDGLSEKLIIVEFSEIDNEQILYSEKPQNENLVEFLNKNSSANNLNIEFRIYNESVQYEILNKFM